MFSVSIRDLQEELMVPKRQSGCQAARPCCPPGRHGQAGELAEGRLLRLKKGKQKVLHLRVSNSSAG